MARQGDSGAYDYADVLTDLDREALSLVHRYGHPGAVREALAQKHDASDCNLHSVRALTQAIAAYADAEARASHLLAKYRLALGLLREARETIQRCDAYERGLTARLEEVTRELRAYELQAEDDGFGEWL